MLLKIILNSHNLMKILCKFSYCMLLMFKKFFPHQKHLKSFHLIMFLHFYFSLILLLQKIKLNFSFPNLKKGFQFLRIDFHMYHLIVKAWIKILRFVCYLTKSCNKQMIFDHPTSNHSTIHYICVEVL